MAKGHLSLGFARQGDTRAPVRIEVMLRDVDMDVVAVIDLTEHDFTMLLSGSSIHVDYAGTAEPEEPTQDFVVDDGGDVAALIDGRWYWVRVGGSDRDHGHLAWTALDDDLIERIIESQDVTGPIR